MFERTTVIWLTTASLDVLNCNLALGAGHQRAVPTCSTTLPQGGCTQTQLPLLPAPPSLPQAIQLACRAKDREPLQNANNTKIHKTVGK